jgi:hypothetical protein
MTFRNAILAAVLAVAPFAAASAAPATITFDGFDGATTPFSPDDVVTFSSPADPGAYFVGDTGGSFTLLAGEALLPNAAIEADLTITWAMPITSASFDVGLVDLTQFFGGGAGGDGITYTANGGESGSVTALLGAGAIYPDVAVTVSGAAFTSVTLHATQTIALDNVTPAPEPASLALLAAGLVGFAAVRRRA